MAYRVQHHGTAYIAKPGHYCALFLGGHSLGGGHLAYHLHDIPDTYTYRASRCQRAGASILETVYIYRNQWP